MMNKDKGEIHRIDLIRSQNRLLSMDNCVKLDLWKQLCYIRLATYEDALGDSRPISSSSGWISMTRERMLSMYERSF